MKRDTATFSLSTSHFSVVLERGRSMNKKINRLVAIDNGDSKVARSLTNKPPAHYTLKIDSFWSLRTTMIDAQADSYESEVFEAGGYKWKLSLYPYGDKGNKGTGYISIYLLIVDTHDLPQDWEVFANLKFYVYDQFKNKYLTVQDANATASRFDRKKTGVGIAKLLPYASLTYAGNGYLVNGKCKFGAEVLVLNYKGTDRCHGTVDTLSMVNASYTWKISKFSSYTKQSYLSDVFTIGHRKWNLKIFPNGAPSVKDNMLSVFLEEVDLDLVPEHKTFVRFELCMVNQGGRKDMHRRHRGCCFSKTSPCFGYSALFPLADLHDAKTGFLVNDTLILKTKVNVFSTVRTISKTRHLPSPNADQLLQAKVGNHGLKLIRTMNISRIFHSRAGKATKLAESKVKKEESTQTEGKSSCSSKNNGVEAPKAIKSRRPWWFY